MKKYKLLLFLALVIIAGVGLFFFCLYQHDMRALGDFAAAYQKFDQAMANQSSSDAGEALVELNATAAGLSGLSSLIKNDSLIPPLALQIADLSTKELDSFAAHKKGTGSKKTFGDLTSQRQAVYAHFLELAK